jgi:hypothetical protein
MLKYNFLLKYNVLLKYFSYTFMSLGILLSFSSCEKVIDVKLNTSASQVVIEGMITDQLGVQTITLSESVPYTNTNTYPAVTGAQVLVTDDNNQSWTFIETKPGTYTFNSLKAEAGRKYTMRVVANNTTYNASSTMPSKVVLDSLTTKVITFGGDDVKVVEAHYQDPADQVNKYRMILKVNGVQIRAVFAENDRLTNGNNVTSTLFYDDDANEELKTGDVAEVELQCIDKDVFTYWFTLSQQAQNGPGSGAAPGNPPSNISNGALGYFSANTTEKKTLTIK